MGRERRGMPTSARGSSRKSVSVSVSVPWNLSFILRHTGHIDTTSLATGKTTVASIRPRSIASELGMVEACWPLSETGLWRYFTSVQASSKCSSRDVCQSVTDSRSRLDATGPRVFSRSHNPTPQSFKTYTTL